MEEKFKDKTVKAITVDPSGPVRQMLAETLKAKGYSNVQSVSSIKEAVEILEVESVGWIMTPLCLDQDINGLKLLNLILNEEILKSVKVTFLVEESDYQFLPYAYENGLLSHYNKPFNKTTLGEQFEAFLTAFEKDNWDATRLSANCLIDVLDVREMYPSKLSFLKKMISLYPGDVTYLFEMVRCQFKLKKLHQVRLLLKQILAINPDQKKKIDEVTLELFGDATEPSEEPSTASEKENLTGMTSCMVVDADLEHRKIICKTFQDLGMKEIYEFEDGESAWTHIEEKGAPQLVFYEWKLQKLSGPYLTQRIHYKSPSTLLVAVSAHISPDDLPLIKEMGLAAVLQKPIEEKDFLKKVIAILQEHNYPASSVAETMELKIIQFLESGQFQKALALRYNYSKLSDNGKNQKSWIEAQFAFAEEKYELARDLALDAINSHSNSISILNFLGKCLIKLNDFPTALKCLEKAQTLSPMNIERLCMIAETHTEVGDVKGANQAIDQAKEQDKSSVQVQESEAKVACITGDAEKAKKIMGELKSLSKLISYMNNKAVAYARGGKIGDSFDMYKKTLDSMPENKKEVEAVVRYNLGLAYTRAKLFDKAQEELDHVINCGETKVLAKSKSLKNKILSSQNEGKILELKGEEPDKEARDIVHATQSKIQAALLLSPGDLCCYLIFKEGVETSDEIKNLTDALPHFKVRSAIERGATGLSDKLFANHSKKS
ncbi:MAG: response regulator [Oligoflexales bacterium]|nr:response regulator [Oligoflexales bacterium]